METNSKKILPSEDEKKEKLIPSEQDNQDNVEDFIPEELSDAMEDMPPEIRKHMEKFMISSVQMGIARPESTVSQKITEEHITKFLEGSQENMENSYKEKHENKIFMAFILFMVFAFIIVIIFLLKDNNPDVMEKIIYTLAGLVAGVFGGYGYGKTKNNSD